MSDAKEKDKKEPLKMPMKLQLTKTVESGTVKQSFTHGRSKTVAVEVRKTRTFTTRKDGSLVEVKKPQESAEPVAPAENKTTVTATPAGGLTEGEMQARMRALKSAEEQSGQPRPQVWKAPAARRAEVEEEPQVSVREKKTATAKVLPAGDEGETEEARSTKIAKVRREAPRRQSGKLTVAQALGLMEERVRSLSSIRRQREKVHKKQGASPSQPIEKFSREVVIPETITVQELANRMAERAADVIKSLMKLGVMATINQSIDADTAELVVGEFGHKVKRVTEADVENVLREEAEDEAHLKPRPPVVTVMGHVDHGKTSLLDALRQANVVAGEAGGITQHIGAYQVELETGEKITFLDTPGHEAFTSMRARGAKVTDIVILVVAADDGIKEQTKEAISHAKAAEVPVIVAINKIDKPDADSARVKNELMQYELIPEEFGGQTMVVEVSAKTGMGLDKLKEAILLQAEVLELRANPDRTAAGAVIEAKVDKGRGVVATLLVQKGTLEQGNIVVAGAAYGRVRSITNDRGQVIDKAFPSQPVEVQGLNQVPEAGDSFGVVDNEKTAREITEFRAKKQRTAAQAAVAKPLETLFAARGEGAARELPVIIKADVHGSAEAIAASLSKLASEEISVKVLFSGVGGISESDITLAKASGALVVAFNVRANSMAKQLADREKVEIKYYSVIYDIVNDVKAALSGMLSPTMKQNFLGYAEIRQVFNISKVGKVAGCMVTEGIIKRGAKVRLLRDNVVIHEGSLRTLKRFKDEVKEVKAGMECGMAFENYDDIREGDQIEAFEMESVARTFEASKPVETTAAEA